MDCPAAGFLALGFLPLRDRPVPSTSPRRGAQGAGSKKSPTAGSDSAPVFRDAGLRSGTSKKKQRVRHASKPEGVLRSGQPGNSSSQLGLAFSETTSSGKTFRVEVGYLDPEQPSFGPFRIPGGQGRSPGLRESSCSSRSSCERPGSTAGRGSRTRSSPKRSAAPDLRHQRPRSPKQWPPCKTSEARTRIRWDDPNEPQTSTSTWRARVGASPTSAGCSGNPPRMIQHVRSMSSSFGCRWAPPTTPKVITARCFADPQPASRGPREGVLPRPGHADETAPTNPVYRLTCIRSLLVRGRLPGNAAS